VSDNQAHLKRLAEIWQAELAKWALPLPRPGTNLPSPFRLDPNRFTPSPTGDDDRRVQLITEVVSKARRSNEVITLLDIGAGAGSSLANIHTLFDHVHAMEVDNEMADRLDVSLSTLRGDRSFDIYRGRFPEDCPSLHGITVVNASNVIYNVGDVLPFLTQLDVLASTLVVIELTLHHPFYPSNEAFQHFHALSRPDQPTATDLFQIAIELGFAAHLESYPLSYRRTSTTISGLMTRLSLSQDRTSELEEFLQATPPPPNPSLLLWWLKS
jgi:hypothetical protein